MFMPTIALTAALLALPGAGIAGDQPEPPTDANAWQAPSPPVGGGHVFPHFAVVAPGTGSRSEAGIGALIPWADRLWAIGYVAHIKGSGLGLYEMRSDLSWRLHPARVTGTFANRFVHWPSEQVFIGPHAIDAKGGVRTIDALKGHRLTATTNHLTDPNKLYFLSMEGLLWEVDARTLESKQLLDLTKELPALVYGGQLQPVRPIATHLRICPDFVHWRGALVLAGDQTDNAVGQPQSGLWFGSIDELAGWGKPTGWGAMWRHEPVKAGTPSDPFLMTGFDRKVLHLLREDDGATPVDVVVEVDFLGDGTWAEYGRHRLEGKGAYIHHEFADAFGAHWVRVKASGDATLTAQLFYQ